MRTFLFLFLIALFGCVEQPKPKSKPAKSPSLQQQMQEIEQKYNGCPDGKCPTLQTSTELNPLPITVKPHQRYKNYVSRSQGSCVHASLATLFMYLGKEDLANRWTDTYGGGETPNGLESKLNAAGILHETITDGDTDFLERYLERGIPAIVTYKPRHMCLLVGFGPRYLNYGRNAAGDFIVVRNAGAKAYIIDPNYPGKIETPDLDAFVSNWRSNGGWATVILP